MAYFARRKKRFCAPDAMLALVATAALLAAPGLSLSASAGSVNFGDDQRSAIKLQLTSSDSIENNGLINKKSNDNLTLSCTLVDSDNVTLPVENIGFNISLFHTDTNRTRIWAEGNTLHLSIESLHSNDSGKYTCFVLNRSEIVVHTFVKVRPPLDFESVPFCSGFFYCEGEPMDKSGVKCVPKTYVCDGKPDCPSAQDESPETCNTTEPCFDKFRCQDGRCIPKNWCCQNEIGCSSHPCCAEQDLYNFPFERFNNRRVDLTDTYVRTGGEYKRNPEEEYYIQATLYKACACLLLVVVTISILISAICRVRLKRIANSRGHLPMDFNVEVPSPDIPDGNPPNISSPLSAVQGRQYSLVRYTDTDSNYDAVNTSCPPSYSEYVAQTNQQFNRPTSRNMSASQTSHSITNTSDERARSNTSELEREDSNSNHNSPARRPNDFGMGIIANAIFNTRYRPVPQQNFEITSLDYATDSDSSCRSPAHRVSNNPLNLETIEFNSHFYGERVGGSPEINLLRGLSDNRRLRHANALDRILDRFGLNAPYNVDLNRDNRTTWECQSFLSPTGSENQNRPRVLSTIWTRLKDRFSRNQQNLRVNHRENRNANSNNMTNISSNFGRHRRRPDTPDVPESTFSERLPHTLTCFLSEDRRLDLCGDSFGELSFHRGLICARDLRVVPAHSFPPPYSQFAPDPPPPYVSRENLIASRLDLNSGPDQNGNLVIANTSTIINENMNAVTVETTPNTAQNDPSSFVAFENCDDNGNVEQTTSNTSSNLNIEASDMNCTNCADDKCVHSSGNIKIHEPNEPSTSTLILESSVNGTNTKMCAINNNANLDTTSDMKVFRQDFSRIRLNTSGDELNGNVTYDNVTDLDYRIVESGEENENIKIVLDQNNPSVHCEDVQTNFEPSNLESSRTDECGLVFPPNNLEFIDSDISDDRNRIEL